MRSGSNYALILLGGLGLTATVCGTCLLNTPAPQKLRAGISQELKLVPGDEIRFEADLQAGQLLELVVEQHGMDIEIQADDKAIDLPLGSALKEELRLIATSKKTYGIRIRAIEGSGTPWLRVRRLGDVGPRDFAATRDFEAYRDSFRNSGEKAGADALTRLAREALEPRWRAIAAISLAATRYSTDPSLAHALLDEASASLEKRPESALTTQLLIVKAKLLDHLGQDQDARKFYQKALEEARKLNDTNSMGLIENDLGFLDWKVNRSHEMLRHYERAVQLYDQAGRAIASRETALILARSLMRHGSSPEPLAILLQGLVEIGPNEPINRAAYLREIGWWLLLESRAIEAEALLNEALKLDPYQAGAWQRLAAAETELGKFSNARESLNQALGLAASPAHRAGIELGLCRIEAQVDNLDLATSHCSTALEFLDKAGIPGARPTFQLALAELNMAKGELNSAEMLAESACARIEDQRQRAGDDFERMGFFSFRTRAPTVLTDVRLALHEKFPSAGYERRALESSELTRGRMLSDLLASERKEEKVRRETSLQRELRLNQILTIRNKGPLQSLLLRGRLDRQEVEPLRALRSELATLRLAADAFKPAEESTSIPFDLAELMNNLEPDTVLLAYYVGDKTSFAWAIRRHGIRGAQLGPSGPIQLLSNSLTQVLTNRRAWNGKSSTARDMERLASLLFSPFAEELESARLVVVVAPPELRQIPFGALPFPADSANPLIARSAIAFLPSAASLNLMRNKFRGRPPAKGLLAIVDDPIYDNDPRLPRTLQRPGPNPPLPDTAKEAEDLLALVDPQGTRSKRFTSFDANLEHLMLADSLAGYRLLHFAVHARLDRPPRGLILSRFDRSGKRIDDVLGLQELYTLSLDADLAVLSACSSGLGEQVPGEGILGLSQGLFQAGIPRLVLSIWPVRGDETGKLMHQFYRRLIIEKQPPAEALREAQLALLGTGADIRDWAAFELFGDWRPLQDSSHR